MSEKDRKAIRRIIVVLLGVITGLIITNIIGVAQYKNLHNQYVDQAIEYNVLLKEHTELTDAYWNIQQNVLKQ